MSDVDPRWIAGVIVLVLFVLILLGLRAGWRAKVRSQSELPSPPAASAVQGELLARSADAHYVATTLDERPLERLVTPPLAFRGRCELEVRSDGLRVSIRGTEPFAIPAASIEATGNRTATIDRVVERDGLTSVSWRLGGADGGTSTPVHTLFRIVDRAERQRVESALAALRTDPPLRIEEPR